MASRSKPSSREFLAKRRKAIAEMAKKRKQQKDARAAEGSKSDASSKESGTRSSLSGSSPPPAR